MALPSRRTNHLCVQSKSSTRDFFLRQLDNCLIQILYLNRYLGKSQDHLKWISLVYDPCRESNLQCQVSLISGFWATSVKWPGVFCSCWMNLKPIPPINLPKSRLIYSSSQGSVALKGTKANGFLNILWNLWLLGLISCTTQAMLS